MSYSNDIMTDEEREANYVNGCIRRGWRAPVTWDDDWNGPPVRGSMNDIHEALSKYVNASVRITEDGCIHPDDADRIDSAIAEFGMRCRRDEDLRIEAVIGLEPVPGGPGDPGDEQEER